MFDIAFSELVVICMVALVVIGPEKLPKLARAVGLLVGRAQRYVSGVKSEISSELQMQELQKLQDEIRLNTLDTESTQFEVGQIIKHKMEPKGAATSQPDMFDLQAAKQQVDTVPAPAIRQPKTEVEPVPQNMPPAQAASSAPSALRQGDLG